MPAKGYIYVDGVNQSGNGINMITFVGNLDMTGKPVVIEAGWADYASANDEVVIYNRALTAKEIEARCSAAS